VKTGGGGTGRRAGADGGTNGPSSSNPTLSAGLAESTLTAGIGLPNEGPELNEPAVDETITLMDPAAASDEPVAIAPGDIITVEIPFEAPEGNVVAAGIRFGEEGPIRQIQIPEAEGETSNVLRFQFEVPPDICDDLAQICHNIVCYEFAVTDIGEVSRANIMPLGLACGGCDEPTCQTLLMCEMPAQADAGGGAVDPMQPVADMDWGEVNFDGTTLPVDESAWDAPCTDATGENTWFHITSNLDNAPFFDLDIFGLPAPGESATAESDEVIASTGATCFIPHFEGVEFCPDGAGSLDNSATCVTQTVTGGSITTSTETYDKTDASNISGTYHHYTFEITLEGGGSVTGDFYGDPSYGF
jgi:hypothetical protein